LLVNLPPVMVESLDVSSDIFGNFLDRLPYNLQYTVLAGT